MRKNWLLTLLFCLVGGVFGLHRFYAGKIKSGILWLLTGGMFGIGWLVDLFLIATGNFTDANGFYIRNDSNSANPNGAYGNGAYQNGTYKNNAYGPASYDQSGNAYANGYGQGGTGTDYGKSFAESAGREAVNAMRAGARMMNSMADNMNNRPDRRNNKSVTYVVGVILACLLLLVLSNWFSGNVNPGTLIVGIIVLALSAAYGWYFILPKMLKEQHIIQDDEMPEAFNPFKAKEDKVVNKPEGRFLGYEETIDGMYAEHYEAMQFYNNLRMHLDESTSEKEFYLGTIACRRFAGKDSPEWHEAYYMLDMNNNLNYLIYNDGKNIYTLKNDKWYIAELPLEKREPDLSRM